MAISIVGTTQVNASSSPLSVAVPSSPASAGDLLVQHILSFSAITLTSSQTSILNGTDSGGFLYNLCRKLAAGGETAMGATNTSGRMNSAIARFSGVDQTTPIETTGAGNAVATNSTGTTFNFPALTPQMDNCYLILVCEDTNNVNTISAIPSGSTALTPGTNGAQTDPGNTTFAMFYKSLGAGSSGVSQSGLSMTWSGGSAFGVAAAFLIRPATGGGANIDDDQII